MTLINADLEKSFYLSDSIDDVNLIQEVKKNPILWDSRLKGYRDEKAKAALFREIADKLGKDDADDVEYRWKILRRTFIRRKKHAIEKSADGIAVIDWPLFKFLSFLAPIVKHRQYPNKRPVILRCEPGAIQNNLSSDARVISPRLLTDLSEDDELKCWNAMETAEETQRQEYPESNQNSMSSSTMEIRKRPAHTVSEITIHDVRGSSAMDTDKLDNRDNDKIRNDADNLDNDIDALDRDNLDFFKSLLPMCRNFTNVQKVDFRLDVMNAVRKIITSQNYYR